MPTGQGAPFHQTSGNQQPGAVADHGDGFLLVDRTLHQFLRDGQVADLVGVEYAAGDHQRVVVFHAGHFEGLVHGEIVGGLVVVPAAHVVDAVGEDMHLRPGIFQGCFRFGQFDLLEAVGDQDGDSLSFEGLGHGEPPWAVSGLYKIPTPLSLKVPTF
ncbi:hypothetical protein D9M73_226120 [compost metagenome]